VWKCRLRPVQVRELGAGVVDGLDAGAHAGHEVFGADAGDARGLLVGGELASASLTARSAASISSVRFAALWRPSGRLSRNAAVT
jgi:hypothetical protein